MSYKVYCELRETRLDADTSLIEYDGDHNSIYIEGMDWYGMNRYCIPLNEEKAQVLVAALSEWLEQRKKDVGV